jgi:hypothetical protein
MLNQDFKDMLQCLLDEKVDFLLVGGYAMAAHGYPRATKDMDIWVWPHPDNATKVCKALTRFGAPMEGINSKDFAQPGIVFQIGVPPNRIDISTLADGVDFSECQRSRLIVDIEGIAIPIISKADIIKNKRAAGRPQDLVDANVLSTQK